jgi:hypothetical protein
MVSSKDSKQLAIKAIIGKHGHEPGGIVAQNLFHVLLEHFVLNNLIIKNCDESKICFQHYVIKNKRRISNLSYMMIKTIHTRFE